MAKKILIIGAGMAGLSAGIHACRNGYDAEIYEQHSLPGGLCTAWERKGYTIDGCIHWLVGTRPGSQFNLLWREVCAIEEMEIINHDIFMNIEGGSGKVLKIYSDLDRLEEHLINHSPADKQVIKNMVDAARVVANTKFPLEKPSELYKLWDMPLMFFSMLPMLKIMGRFSRISIKEYMEQLAGPFLKEALSLIMPGGYSMISLISTLASLHSKDAGFPKGGSKVFARSLEKRFLELGGKINYKAAVEEILVEDNQAVGLLLKDGSKVFGDIIVSAADLHSTVYGMLNSRYRTAKIDESFAHLPVYSSVQVSIGVDTDLSGEVENAAVKLNNPITLGGEHNRYIYLTNFSFDPSLAPAGKTVLRATLYSSYEHWARSADNKNRYDEKKERLAELVKGEFEKRFPAVKGKIDMVDVATPVTYSRYTGVWKGAYMAWIVPPEVGRFKISKELPGLSNFYQIGQWVEPPAGLPGSMLTGRHVIQIICSRDRKAFQA